GAHAAPAAVAVQRQHAHAAAPGTRSTRTAHTLNSGIREVGSRAGLVSRLARASPVQWNGMNTVSERIAVLIRATPSAVPRRLVTRTRSPGAMPSRSARSGWISTYASGAASL